MFPIFAPNNHSPASVGTAKSDRPSKTASLEKLEPENAPSKFLSRTDLERIVEDLFENSTFRLTVGSKLERELGR